jgi:putative flippase GtrA
VYLKELLRFIKFTFFSISAGAIELGAFAVFNEWMCLPYWLSYLVALLLSVLWNFTLNRKFTFKSTANIPAAMLKVFLYYCAFIPISTFLEHYLTSIGWNEYLVTIINMLLNFATEFLFQRFMVYRTSIDTNY